jgi:hypothetical protein
MERGESNTKMEQFLREISKMEKFMERALFTMIKI